MTRGVQGIGMSGNALAIREDETSWQLLGPGKLFIRITSAKSERAIMVFSDFIIHEAQPKQIQAALETVRAAFRGPAQCMQLVFQDIIPTTTGFPSHENAGLVERQNKIIEHVRLLGKKYDFKISRSILTARGNKIDLLIFLS